MEQERLYPEATGELSNLLYDLCLAAKIISRHVRRAGLTDILGASGAVNVSGDLQQKLDLFAHDTIQNAVQYTGRVCLMASEEDEQPMLVPPGKPVGKYVLLYDPLDGSTNIDVNVSIGTIFSIHRRMTDPTGPAALADCLQVGRKQVAAGYILYGSSTMLVYTTGQGVHGFTLDPTIGEFLLSHPDIRTPEVGKYYSVNESNWNKWTPAVQRVVSAFKNGDGGGAVQKNARYIGSLVADFHRNLMSGGIFLYPADTKSPQGKLRLLYEAAPLALVVEQAGGAATDGRRPILDLTPASLHQRTPLIIGSRADVAFAMSILSAEGGAPPPPPPPTLLLVEDEESLRASAAKYLEKMGYRVLSTASGTDALRLLREAAGRAIDLVITDLVIPGLSGRELAERIRRDRADLPVLLTSGYKAARVSGGGARSAFAAFLQKPYTVDELGRKVEELLGAAPARSPR